MIDYHTWNTGTIDYSPRTDTLAFYNAERGTTNGKACTSGTYCNDTVERTTKWQGYVALPYVTDWAYASGTDGCETNMQQQDSSNVYTCRNDNWMHYNSSKWYLSPRAHSDRAVHVWRVRGDGDAGGDSASYAFSVFPSIYLNSDVEITSGSGSSSDPYILGV